MAEAKRKAFHVALDQAYATYDQVRNSAPERQTDIFAPPQPAGPLPFGIVTGVARDRLLDLGEPIDAGAAVLGYRAASLVDRP